MTEDGVTVDNRMTSAPSPQGRRILVALVTGEAGDRIQSWRRLYDRTEAERLPPHVTLCYWAPDASVEDLDRQVRHAYPAPIEVHLGHVRQGDNEQRTMFVEIPDPKQLSAGLDRLYDGTYVAFPSKQDWHWHITCVRDTRGRDLEALREAARQLVIDGPWRFDTIALLELRGESYAPIVTWTI